MMSIASQLPSNLERTDGPQLPGDPEGAQVQLLGSAQDPQGAHPAEVDAEGLQLDPSAHAREAKDSADKAAGPRAKKPSFEGVLAHALAPAAAAPVKSKEPSPGKAAPPTPQPAALALKATAEGLSSWKPRAPTVEAEGGEPRKEARAPLRPKEKDDAAEPTPTVAAAAPAPTFEVKASAPIEAPREAAQLPANFLPADARADAALRVAVNANNARAQISTAQGPLAIELFLKNGAADIRLQGALGPQLAAHQSDMRLALVASGLRLATLQGVRTLPSEGASVRSDARGSDTPPEGDTP